MSQRAIRTCSASDLEILVRLNGRECMHMEEADGLVSRVVWRSRSNRMARECMRKEQ
jgi:hypothetical protein